MAQSASDKFDHLFKIVLAGDGKVGKTQILNRWLNNEFKENYKPTVGIDFNTKMYAESNKSFKLQILDAAGQERYQAIFNYFRGAHGALLVFDVSNLESFSNLDKYLAEIKANAREGVVIFLVANKVDLEADRVVTKEMAEDFA
ncbi:MAG: Rab family GTPase, partial [Gammaproteobacteria bacterium]